MHKVKVYDDDENYFGPEDTQGRPQATRLVPFM